MRTSLIFRLAAWTLLPCSLLAQSPKHSPQSSAKTGNSKPSGPALDSLPSLQQAQVQAVASQDPPAITAATVPYLVDLLRRLALAELASGHIDKAVERDEQAMALQSSPELSREAASLLLRSNRPAEAADLLQRATESASSNDSRTWVLRGLAERAANRDASAVASFQRALQLHRDADIAYALASQLLVTHQEDAADKVFRSLFAATGDDPLWHVAAGDAYRESRYYNKAVAQFQMALARDPRALHAEFFLGLTYLQMNEWGPNSQSFEHLRRAVAISPHEFASNFYLGALESTDGSDLPSSDRHLQVAAQADPSQPEVWLYLGQNANREHRSDIAERDLRKCIELTGKDESRNGYQVRRAYFALGRLLIAHGSREEGTALLARYKAAETAAVGSSAATIAEKDTNPAHSPGVLSISGSSLPSPVTPLTASTTPSLPPEELAKLRSQMQTLQALAAEAYNDLGTAEARQHEYAKALASYQASEHLGSVSPTVLRNIGMAAFEINQFAEASRALRLYLNLQSKEAGAPNGSDPRADLVLGFSNFNLGNFSEAAEAFGAAPDATLADARAAYSWAFSLAKTGHAQEANALAKELSAMPMATDVLGLVCHIYVDDEDYEDSLNCYRKQYAADPSVHLAHYEAGEALIHLDRAQEALTELNAERALSPEDPNVTYAYAYALLQVSRKDEAERLLVNLVAAHPEHSQAQYQLGKLLLDGGKLTDAISHLEASERADGSLDYVHYQLGTAYKKAGRITDAEREFNLFREIKEHKRAAIAAPPS